MCKKQTFISYHHCHPFQPDSAAVPTDPLPVLESLSQAGPCAGSPLTCEGRSIEEAPGSLQDIGPARHEG